MVLFSLIRVRNLAGAVARAVKDLPSLAGVADRVSTRVIGRVTGVAFVCAVLSFSMAHPSAAVPIFVAHPSNDVGSPVAHSSSAESTTIIIANDVNASDLVHVMDDDDADRTLRDYLAHANAASVSLRPDERDTDLATTLCSTNPMGYAGSMLERRAALAKNNSNAHCVIVDGISGLTRVRWDEWLPPANGSDSSANGGAGTTVALVAIPRAATSSAGLTAGFAVGELREPLPVVLAGRGGQLLASNATRTDGLITFDELIDLTSGKLEGEKSRRSGDTVATQSGQSLRAVVDFQHHAVAASRAQPLMFTVWAVLSGIVLVGALCLSVRTRRHRSPMVSIDRHRRWLTLAATAVFSITPAAIAINFFPWWRLPGAHISVIVIVIGAAFATTLTLHVLRRITHDTTGVISRAIRHPVAVLAATSFALIAGDLIAGSTHQANGLVSHLTLVAARYYGVSNRVYVILIATVFLMAHPLLGHRGNRRVIHTVGVLSVLGIFTLTIDAAPMWGADFGGIPGIIVGFAAAIIVATTVAAGRTLRPRTVVYAGAIAVTAIVVTMLAVSAIDASLGSRMSHIGRFYIALREGRAVSVVAGKAQAMLHTFTDHPALLTIVVAVVAIGAVGAIVAIVQRERGRRRGRRHSPHHLKFTFPGARVLKGELSKGALWGQASFIGCVIAVLAGVFINDSGVIVALDALMIAAPGFLAQSLGSSCRGPRPATHAR